MPSVFRLLCPLPLKPPNPARRLQPARHSEVLVDAEEDGRNSDD